MARAACGRLAVLRCGGIPSIEVGHHLAAESERILRNPEPSRVFSLLVDILARDAIIMT
jgi:hypothetical protein